METILLLMAIPLFLGMFFAYKFPKTTKKLTKPIKTISLIAFFGFVIGALLNNFDLFLEHIIFIIPIVLIHNLLAFTTGWSAARAVGLSRNDRKTITIETGIQNSGLALILFFNHKIFPEGYGGVAFIAAWWGIWHIISGLILSQFFKRDKKKEVQKELA